MNPHAQIGRRSLTSILQIAAHTPAKSHTVVTKMRTGSARFADKGLISAVDSRAQRTISAAPPPNTPKAPTQNSQEPSRLPMPESRSPPGINITTIKGKKTVTIIQNHPIPRITLKIRLAGRQPMSIAHWIAPATTMKISASRTKSDGKSTPRNR